jgi:hypothetical protein
LRLAVASKNGDAILAALPDFDPRRGRIDAIGDVAVAPGNVQAHPPVEQPQHLVGLKIHE